MTVAPVAPLQFAAVEQLSAYLQTEIVDPAQVDSANLALALATAAVQASTGQYLAAVTGDQTLLDGTGRAGATQTLLLPQLPVTDVTSVETLDVNGDWTLAAYPADYDWNAIGLVVKPGTYGLTYSTFPAGYRNVRVTYDHGYEPVPIDIVGVTLSAAARIFTNPQGILSESIEGYSVRYESTRSSGIQFSPLEEDVLGRYRLVSIA